MYMTTEDAIEATKARRTEISPTHGQNIPTVNRPRTGPATMPLTLIAAWSTVPVIVFATNAAKTAPMPERKTMSREKK